MATLLELITQKTDRYDSVPLAYEDGVIIAQRKIFGDVIELISQLETSAGSILVTTENLAIVDQIAIQLREVLNRSEYIEATRSFIKEFDGQAAINQEIFSRRFADFSESEFVAGVTASSKRSSTQRLIGAPLDPEFIEPIRQLLDDAVSTGAGIGETVLNIRTIVEGNEEVLGRLHRYSKQISSDLFSTYDSSYTNATADDLELEFYQYTGGLLTDSREFCIPRNGKFFHKAEVSWWVTGQSTGAAGNPTPNKEWQGKTRGTNKDTIFIWRGGHNCKHALLPVSAAAVPKDVLQRNIANGNFSPTPREAELLNL